VFRLITFCISIVGFAVIVWFGVTVELGDRTLFGHLRAIGGSHEAQQLWDGTKGKVSDFVGIEAARRAEAAKEAFKHPPAAPAPAIPGKAVVANNDPDPAAAPAKAHVATAPVPPRAAKVTPTHTQIAPVGPRPHAAAQRPK
jgi:hypothetical protein